MDGPLSITGGGLSSFEVIVSLVLAEAEPAWLTAEQTTTVPESCMVVLVSIRMDLPSGVVMARYLSEEEPEKMRERSPSMDQKVNGEGLP